MDLQDLRMHVGIRRLMYWHLRVRKEFKGTRLHWPDWQVGTNCAKVKSLYSFQLNFREWTTTFS